MKNTIFCIQLLLITCTPVTFLCAAEFPSEALRSYTEFNAGKLNERLRARVMAQDAYGFLWFGGSNGLWRYDGYRLKHLSHEKDNENSLRDNDIYALAADHKGGLWVNTGHHISHYDIRTETFKHYSAASGKPFFPVTTELNHIAIGDHGDVWFSGYNGVSYLAEGSEQFVNYGADSSLADGAEGFIARSTLPLKNGDVYVGTNFGLAFKKRGDTSFQYLHREGDISLRDVEVTYVVEDARGVQWIGTMKSGVFWVGSDGKLQHQARRDGAYSVLAGTKAWMMMAEGDEIWVLTSKSGIFILDALTGDIKSQEGVNEQYPFGIDLVDTRAGLKLKSGQMIFSGDPGENGDSKIQMFSPQKDYVRWIHRSKINGAKRQDLLSGVIVGEDLLLFGKDVIRFNIESGVLPLKSKALESLREKLKADPSYLSYLDSLGRIWLTSLNAVSWVVDLELDTLKKIDIGGSECTAYDAHRLTPEYLAYECVDDAGVVLVNTKQGDRHYYAFDHKAHFVTWAGAAELENSDVVVGSSVGVMALSAEDREKKTAKLKSVALKDIRTGRTFLDDQKTLWIDSDIGLHRLKRGKAWRDLELVQPDDAQNFMHFAYRDGYGRIWGGGGFLDTQNNRFNKLGNEDGYRMANTYFGEPLELDDGSWAVIHAEGIQIINPSVYQEWSYNTPLRISDLRFDGQHQKGVDFPEVVVAPSTRKLSLEVVALDFESNFRKQYHYILEGYNDGWQKGGNENRHIVFENLPSGRYNLRVRGSGYRGIMGADELALSIIVLPAWYQTWWFRGVMLTLLVFSIALCVRYRERYLQEKQRKLEHLVALGTAELADKNRVLNTTLEQLNSTQESLIEQEKVLALGKMIKGLAHEVNTPLGIAVTAISDVEDRATTLKVDFSDGNLSENKLKTFIDILIRSSQMAGRNLGRAHELISSFRELGLDKSIGVEGEIDIVDFVRKSCANLAADDESKYHYAVHGPESLMLAVNPADVSRIITKLLSNCLMHARKPDRELEVDVFLSYESGELNVRVRDNGPGIAKENVREIFEPFFTTLRAHGGIGLGLSFVYNLVVHKMDGSIQLNLDYLEGAEFILKLPLRKDV